MILNCAFRATGTAITNSCSVENGIEFHCTSLSSFFQAIESVNRSGIIELDVTTQRKRGAAIMRLLLVEDDAFLSDGIALALRHNGYIVDQARSGTDADHAINVSKYDLVVLDLGLPELDGIEVLKRIRGRGTSTPVLIVTARDTVQDRVFGLDSGANDYICKPFELPELEARIRALLRKEQWGNQTRINFGPVEFDTVDRCATLNGQNLDLSARELAVLELLLQRAGKVVNKQTLITSLSTWDAELSHNALEIIVHRLRKKLESPDLNIRTVRGLGYMLEKPA